ncbi:hypothetical protein IWW57_003161, partial [Coemansia sp. S610]
WRATEILKAAREGRVVSPPKDDGALEWPSPPAPSESITLPAPSVSYSAPPAPPAPPAPVTYSPPVAYPDPRSMSPPAHSTFTMPVSSSSPAFIPVPAANLPPPPVAEVGAPVDPDQLLDPAVAKKAQKLARWAISALEYDDVNNAIDNLREAIQVLLPFKK